MPISSFGEGLQRVISFLPGTYGTALLRNHTLRGAFEELGESGLPVEVLEALKDAIDYNVYFFNNKVETAVMYAILGVTVAILIGAYILINSQSKKTK